MRKLVVMALSFLLPFAAWMAGCRQEQASFPGGPEMKNLAQAPGGQPGGYKEAPFIPAAIDPEVLAMPDQGTFSRIQAVMDREALLASRQAAPAPGLFVMPRQEFPELAQYEPLPEPVHGTLPASAPMLATTREFWSRPAEVMPAPSMQAIPADVSAMMPASSVARQEPLLVPETIPGVYMGLGAVETFESPSAARQAMPAPVSAPSAPSMASQIAAPNEIPLMTPPEANGGWEDNRRPPFLVGGLNPSGMSPPNLTVVETREIPLSLDWAAGAGGTASAPDKLKSLFERLSLKDALAPLARLSALDMREAPKAPIFAAKAPLDDPEVVSALAGLEPMSENSLEKTAMGLTHMGGLFMAPGEGGESSASSERELYMTDFWLNKPAAKAGTLRPETEMKEMQTAVVGIEPIQPAKTESLRPPGETPEKQKVTLREGRGGRRKAAFAEIDSLVDSPPLKF